MILLKELLEAPLSTERKVRDAVIAASNGALRSSPKKDRVYAKDVTGDEFIKIIKTTYPNAGDVTVIPKNESGSKSSMFDTFAFDADGAKVSLVLAKGVVAGEAGEIAEVAAVQKVLDEVGPITIEVAGTQYPGITKIERVAGNKKADFVMSSDKGRDIFIQHKSPTHQQMAGIRNLAKDGRFKKEIGDFVELVRKEAESKGGRLEGRVSAPITDDDLKLVAAYGTDDAEFSDNAVQIYCIGNISLVKSGDAYKLKGSKGTYEYPTIPTGGDEPMLGATYRKGRKQQGIADVRFGIYPKSYLGIKEADEETDTAQ